MVPRTLAISPPRIGPWTTELGALRAAGVDALLLRLVDEPTGLRAALQGARGMGLTVLVRPVSPGDRDIALAAGVGLHTPDAGPPSREDTVLHSTSCHGAARVAAAAAAGLDLCTLSPIFAPGSKPGDRRPTLGLAGLAAATRATPGFPVLALGGIRAERVPALLRAGAHGVAGITGFFDGLRVDRVGAARIVAAVASCNGPAPTQ
jgi:thiamine monophosphate synthase